MTEDTIAKLATLVLEEPDRIARLQWVKERYDVPDDPGVLFQAGIQLTLLEYVEAELGQKAVKTIRAKHRRRGSQ